MSKYIVLMKEIHTQPILIEAKSEKDAVDAVMNGMGDYIDSGEYIDVLPTEQWEVKDVNDDTVVNEDDDGVYRLSTLCKYYGDCQPDSNSICAYDCKNYSHKTIED